MEFDEQLGRMVAEAEGREWVPPEPGPEPEPQSEPVSEAEFQAQLDQIVRDSQRGREPEPETDPEAAGRAAMYAEIHEDLAAIGDGIRELAAQVRGGRARRAEAQRGDPEEPARGSRPRLRRRPGGREPSWQAGSADPDAGQAAADIDMEAEI